MTCIRTLVRMHARVPEVVWLTCTLCAFVCGAIDQELGLAKETEDGRVEGPIMFDASHGV